MFSWNFREECRILGYERAYARSYPKMRGPTTEVDGVTTKKMPKNKGAGIRPHPYFWEILYLVVLHLLRFGDHSFEQNFKSHCMAATLVGNEELAITFELTIGKTDLVIIVVTAEGYVEIVEPKTLGVFGVALGFLDFSNQSIVHVSSPFIQRNKKARRQARAFQEFLAEDVR
jgi:hypothetical protein